MAQRDSEIKSMIDRVARAEKESADAVAEHKRRTQEVEKVYEEKTVVLQDQLRKQMQRMLEEQGREMEEIQVEFSAASTLL